MPTLLPEPVRGHGGALATAAGAGAAALTACEGWQPVAWALVCAAPLVAATGLLRSGGRRTPSAWIGAAAGIALVGIIGVRAGQDLAGLSEPLPARIEGVAELGTDPERRDHGVTAEVVAAGRRWYAEFDRDTETAVATLRTGQRLSVTGSTSRFRDAPPGWVRSRHLAGRLRVDTAAPAPGTRPWFSAANGVHSLLRRGSASMSEEHRSLYLGLVLGDDRGQEDTTRFRFRASGLTHLLAVSGQNMVFVLAVLSPLTSRVTFRWRWLLGATAIVGFVLVTRAEPSVLRAASMAVLGLTAMSMGRAASGVRLLALTIPPLLVADPMLVHSVGFRLSVAATAGLVLLARPVARWLRGPSWMRTPLAVTVAAQLGAVPVMTATFGPTSVLAVPANMLAEPAAALVMTSGLTAGLLAGAVREELAWLLQLPSRIGVWWVDTVATSTATLSVPPSGLPGWLVLLGGPAAALVLWKRRRLAAVGRVALLALAPAVLLLRPPPTDAAAASGLRGPVELSACGDRWVATVQEEVDERVRAEVMESLWRFGTLRVSVLRVPEDTTTAQSLAADLHAEMMVDPGPAGGGQACRFGP